MRRWRDSHRPTGERLTREDTSAMADLRFERFSDPAFLAHIAEGQAVPPAGWAIRSDGAVFCDGAQVGQRGKYVFNRASGTPYGEIVYEGLDEDATSSRGGRRRPTAPASCKAFATRTRRLTIPEPALGRPS